MGKCYEKIQAEFNAETEEGGLQDINYHIINPVFYTQ